MAFNLETALRPLGSKFCEGGSVKPCSFQMRLIASEPDDDFGRSLAFRRRLQSKLGYNAVESFHENHDGLRVEASAF